MTARQIDEPHRISSHLELLFDLIFVVAVAAVTAQFADRIATGHPGSGLVGFLEVFFAIWWAWMNFTWFASSYDTDDVAYRLLTMVQMGGVLVLAAGVPTAARSSDFLAVTIGYVIMRIGLGIQWLRAGIEYPSGRRTAFRYAGGITVLQLGWVLRQTAAGFGVLRSAAQVPSFVVLATLELVVPPWAERGGATSWHPHHIADRYGLFTIILLGESVLATSTAVQNAVATSRASGALICVAVAGFILLCSLWWLYFLHPSGDGLSQRRGHSYLWGYGHYGVFAALAALGSGLEIAVEQTAHSSSLSKVATTYAVAGPTATFVLLLWLVHRAIVTTPVVEPALTVTGAMGILIAPLAANVLGVPAVLAAIATVPVLLVVTTLSRR